MRKIIVYIFVVVLSIVMLYRVWCAQEEDISPEVKVGDKAINFTLMNLDGESISLEDFIGKKNILLVFTTTWCPYCVKEIPGLKKVNARYKMHMDVISIYIRESHDKILSFAQQKGLPYIVLLDSNEEAARKYQIRGVPTLIVIDKEGIIRKIGHSVPEDAFFDELIREGR